MDAQKNESFVRWQGRSLEQLGIAINLLLSLCLATIGFTISKLLDKDFIFLNHFTRKIILLGSFNILLTILLVLFLIYNRLHSFKKTTQIARKRETNNLSNIDILREKVKKADKLTWLFFNISLVSFALGEILVFVGFIFQIINRP